MRKLLATFSASALLLSAVPLTHARHALAGSLDGLMSSGPAPDVADKMMLGFGRVVGQWDLDYTAQTPDGKKVAAKCEWNFSWVLDGRAVQDVWVCPSRAERARDPKLSGEWGSTMRVYDKKLDLWHVVFFGPSLGNINQLTARAVGGDIIQESTDSVGHLMQWNFGEITPNSFHWYSQKSTDNGKTWTRQEDMYARRRD